MTDLLSPAPAIRLISIELAQEHLETVLEKVEAGQEFWITRDDKPVACLVPLTAGERKVFAEESAHPVPPEVL